MNVRLVFHVGPHKTASTHLQACFHGARAGLANGGWSYPRLGRAFHHKAHHLLAVEPERFRKSRAIKRLGMRARATQSNLLFSSENLVAWPAVHFKNLAATLGTAPPEILYVLRDPLVRLASYWAEEVKQGSGQSLADRLASELADPFASALLNPIVTLRPWKRASLHLHISPFEIITRRGEPLFDHVARRVLHIKGAFPSDQDRNARLPLELTEFMRFLNQMHGAAGPRLRQCFMAGICEAEQKELAGLLAEEAAGARQTVHFPAAPGYLRHIENRLRAEFADCFTCVPNEPLFSDAPLTCDYYSDAGLWRSAKLRSRAKDVLRRIAA